MHFISKRIVNSRNIVGLYVSVFRYQRINSRHVKCVENNIILPRKILKNKILGFFVNLYCEITKKICDS